MTEPTPTDRLPGRWYRLTVTSSAGHEDDLVGLLHLLDVLGIEVGHRGRTLTLDAWFSSEEECTRAAASISARFDDDVAATPRGPVEDDGWLAAAAPRGEPVRAGRFLVIDTEEPLAADVEEELATIHVPRSRAFGTGEHPTTSMCLELLSGLDVSGRHVLDMGCGSGILSLAAARCGAECVLAVDDDPDVEEVLNEGIERNGVAGRVVWRRGSWGSLERSERFDLALANIHRTALERGAGRLCEHLPRGATAIVSGFLEKDRSRVAEAFVRAGASLRETRVAEGDESWTALSFLRD